MFVKLHLDTGHCFSVLGSSTKIVPKIGVSENIEALNKDRKNRALRTPNGIGVPKKKLGESQRQTCERTNGCLVREPKKLSFAENPRREHRGVVRKDDSGGELERGNVGFAAKESHAKCSTKWVNRGESGKRSFVEKQLVGIVEKKDSGEELKRESVDSALKKVHAKCSTKWVNYGGSIPAILRALDEIGDLDEALRPWEESLNNKERSIILKEQSDWERALEIFEWFKRKGCHELNVIHYNIVLRTLGRARKWSYVESLWDEMLVQGIAPINSTYGTLIDVYSKGGLKEQALCWLARMNKQGIDPDEVTMGIVVQLYKKSGEFRKAEDFFKKWSLGESARREGETESDVNPRGCLSSHTYNTLIDTYGKAGQLKEASEVFAQMLREGIAPTTVTFNTMIHICGNNGLLEEVTSLMKKMDELRCQPDTRTYNILIFLHAKRDDIATATKYFVAMKEALLEPDLVSYRTLLYAYSIRLMVSEAEELVLEMDSRGLEIDEFTQSALTRMYIEAGELEKSWLWFKRFHLGGNMSSECYSANIDAYGERGFVSEAENVFRCGREAMKRPSVLEFNVMIKAYGIGKRYREACDLFDSMESHGVAPDKCSYSSLIQILAGADMAHGAKSYLGKMQGSGFVTDCIPYCAVISSFTKLGKLEMAESLYKEMVGSNVRPDIIVFGILINAFADVGSVKEALGYVDEMKKAGLPGNEVIYNSLIKLYTKVGRLSEAQEIYELLESSSEEGPALYSSNCMIDLYSERSMVGPAEKIFEGLKRKGSANEFTFAMMLCLYRKIGRFDDAVAIARQMRDQGLLTDLLSYNNAIALYAACGRFREAAATFEEMLKRPLRPDDCTFKSLGVVLVKSGVSKLAVAKLKVSAERDLESAIPKWVSALSSVVIRASDYNDDS